MLLTFVKKWLQMFYTSISSDIYVQPWHRT